MTFVMKSGVVKHQWPSNQNGYCTLLRLITRNGGSGVLFLSLTTVSFDEKHALFVRWNLAIPLSPGSFRTGSTWPSSLAPSCHGILKGVCVNFVKYSGE